ncbi:unnamed protein product [Closterium sp. Yama58-4]|nr:unnamed protein product [Closterium sp. Yama58-4]
MRMETVEAWRGAMLPAIARTSPLRSLVPDLVSPLLSVISATPIRPVAGQLLTPWEKAALAQLVATMLDYGLSYRHAHQLPWHRRAFAAGSAGGGEGGVGGGGDGYMGGPVLDPPLTEFVVFEPHQEPQAAAPPQAANGISQSSKGKGTQEGDGQAKENGIPMESKAVKPQDASGSVQQGSDAKPAKVKDLPRRPFWGFTRKVEQSSRPKTVGQPSGDGGSGINGADNKTASEKAIRISFKYHEGFTNAVRRPVLFSELL